MRGRIKLLSLLLAIVMIAGTILPHNNIVFAANIEGLGTKTSPYLILTADDLIHIDNEPSAYYKIVNDLDMEHLTQAPLGEFNGVLDGNGKVIRNLIIEGAGYTGLFSKLTNATVKNIIFENCTVTSSGKYTGLIAGYAINSKLKNCAVKNSRIHGVNTVGALAGHVFSSEVLNGYSESNHVSGLSMVGGAFGTALYTTISQCYSTSTVYGEVRLTGGLIGQAQSGTKLDQSFSNSAVSGSAIVGGLVGEVSENSVGTEIKNCYSTGSVHSKDAANSLVNGNYATIINNSYFTNQINMPANYAFTAGIIVNSFYDKQVSGFEEQAAYGRQTEEMMHQSNYKGWDFSKIWMIEEGSSYPHLKFEARINDPYEEEENPAPEPGPESNKIPRIKVVLEPGEALQLSVSEEMTNNKKITWTTSSSTVASVDENGVVNALDLGKTVIKAVNKNGKYVSYVTVSVVEDATDYRLAIDMKVGETRKLNIEPIPGVSVMHWISSNYDVVIPSYTGKIIANSVGLAVIWVADYNLNEIESIYVRVRQ